MFYYFNYLNTQSWYNNTSNTMPTPYGKRQRRRRDRQWTDIVRGRVIVRFYENDFFSQCAFAAYVEWCMVVGVGWRVVRNDLATDSRGGEGGNNVVCGCWPKSAHSVYGVFTPSSTFLPHSSPYTGCLWRTLLAFLACSKWRRLTPKIRRRFRLGVALQVVHPITWAENNVSDDWSD